MNLELIRNLAASHADNDVALTCLRIRDLGEKHAWTVEEMKDIADLVAEIRNSAIVGVTESVMTVFKEHGL